MTPLNLSVNTGLSLVPDTQNKELFNELVRVYNAINMVASSLDAYTGALSRDPVDWPSLSPSDTIHSQWMNRLYVLFSANATAGQMIDLWNNAGALNARPAGGAAWLGIARGFSTGAVTAGNYGEVILGGLHEYVAGLVPGTVYYLDAAGPAGNIVAVAPGVGFRQPIGYALSGNRLFFQPALLAF